MSDTNAEYRFDAFLQALSDDWYADDPLLGALLDRHAPGSDRRRIETFGPMVAGRLRELAERSSRTENAPRLVRRDPYDRRVDEIELPGATRDALRIVHGEMGLGAVLGDPFIHYAMVYLLTQNGEAGVACSLACTDGLVRALDALGSSEAHQAAIDAVRDSSPGAYRHGAQFVTEIQGGSDVPANRVRAERDGPVFRIHGQKWFCSNINADWFLVTARPGDADTVGLFLVPAYEGMVGPQSGDGGRRNGYTIDRLKDKLGTRELATAEVTFDGAVAWPVGPLERGIANLLRYVLTPSRVACVLFAAGALRRAERIVDEYIRFREAFGQPIGRFPLVARQVESIRAAREGALVVGFELIRLWETAELDEYRGRDADDFRILLSLAKPVLTRLATDGLHQAMMLLAGNGIEERFSPLPRLYRDSVIMETWEGPHNVLYTQALRDMVRFGIDPWSFLNRVGREAMPSVAEALQTALGGATGPTAPVDGTLIIEEVAPGIIEAVARRARPD
jgi:alkylation response protein AidB-like acyl-CoA dehydrogenase